MILPYPTLLEAAIMSMYQKTITLTEQQDKWVTVITIGCKATISPLLCSSKTARLHL